MGFSLASLNLHCGLDRHGRPYSVTAAVGALDADVLLVQENWRPRGQASLARRAAQDHGYLGVAELDLIPDAPIATLGIVRGIVPAETGAFGLAVLSRLPLRECPPLPLGAAPGDVTGERFAQVTEIAFAPDAVLRVVNTHLTHRLPYGPRQLRRLITGLGREGLPTVIGGDLNMCRPTIELARPYRPALRGRTWPSHRPVAQIDHLLAGPGVEITEGRVAPDVGSDHLPIRATVTLTRRPALAFATTAEVRDRPWLGLRAGLPTAD